MSLDQLADLGIGFGAQRFEAGNGWTVSYERAEARIGPNDHVFDIVLRHRHGPRGEEYTEMAGPEEQALWTEVERLNQLIAGTTLDPSRLALAEHRVRSHGGGDHLHEKVEHPHALNLDHAERVAEEYVIAGLAEKPAERPCPISSAITAQPCLLPFGHAQYKPDRFHKFAPPGRTQPPV